MNWIKRKLGYLLPTPEQRKSKSGRSLPAPQSKSFRGVTIFSTDGCCEAATRLESHRFLAQYAPQLPLGGCSQANVCRCRYRHLADRRLGPRRDSDNGLPGVHYLKPERRFRNDRRRA